MMMMVVFSFFVNYRLRMRNWWLGYNFLLLILNYKSSSCFTLLTYNFWLVSNLSMCLIYWANSSTVLLFTFLYHFWISSFYDFWWLSKSCLSIIIFLNFLTLSSLIRYYLLRYIAFFSLPTLILLTWTCRIVSTSCIWLFVTSWIC